jgi:hypothetical protein
MEGPTSSGGLRNRLTSPIVHEHDDDEVKVIEISLTTY